VKNRRGLLIVLGVTAFVPRMALAQAKQGPERAGKPMRVGILTETTAGKSQVNEKPFIDAMRELGWTEGRNIVYDRAYADDDATRLLDLAAALVGRRPDVIHVRSTQPALAVFAHTRAIPIVFGGVSDPDERGLVKSLARPGGNVTGTTPMGGGLGGKRLQLVKQALPRISRVGVLVNPSYSPISSKDYKMVQEAAVTLGITVVPAMVNAARELDAAFALFAKSRAEAVLLTQNPLFGLERKRILEIAATQRVPVIGTGSGLATEGALMSYGAQPTDLIRRTAVMVDKILKGAKPADIPVEQPAKFELVVNLKTAKALGITIPQAFLVTADRVIE
jgi:ABC-type uncharacterized transport system substrate-binding protein